MSCTDGSSYKTGSEPASKGAAPTPQSIRSHPQCTFDQRRPLLLPRNPGVWCARAVGGITAEFVALRIVASPPTRQFWERSSPHCPMVKRYRVDLQSDEFCGHVAYSSGTPNPRLAIHCKKKHPRRTLESRAQHVRVPKKRRDGFEGRAVRGEGRHDDFHVRPQMYRRHVPQSGPIVLTVTYGDRTLKKTCFCKEGTDGPGFGLILVGKSSKHAVRPTFGLPGSIF